MKRIVLLGSVLALLAGCATQPSLTGPEKQAYWSQHKQVLEGISHWDLDGRLAVRAGDHGWQASLRWKRSGVTQTLALYGPIGTNHVVVEQDANGAWLRDSRGHEYRDIDASHLLKRVTGWQLPVSSLAYWVRGLAAPGGSDQIQLDGRGRLSSLNQQNWTVRILSYGDFNGVQLPQKIDMTHYQEDNVGANLHLRLVIDAWNVSR